MQQLCPILTVSISINPCRFWLNFFAPEGNSQLSFHIAFLLQRAKMAGIWTAIGGGIVALFVLVIWYTSPTFTADEPRPFPHTIPVIGHLIPFAKDRRSLFKKL
jgi:hypothetical protein